MYSLLIDTHDSNVLFVLYKDSLVIDKLNIESKMRHSEVTMPSLNEIISRNHITIKNLNELIVVIGPGSFTGVRIGVVIAKTAAYLLNIPIKTITSIDLKVFSNKKIIPGKYFAKEKNGYFIGEYDMSGKLIGEIKYIGKDEFNIDEYINLDNMDYNQIYTHLKNQEPINPHLVNPIYIKQIEALKWFAS